MERPKTVRLEESLEKLSLPSIATPLHKERLRAALLREMECRQGRRATLPKVRFLYAALPLVAALLLVIIWQGMFTPPPTMAFATLQANPAFELAIDTRGRVAALSSLSGDTGALFSPTDFRHVPATKALPEIISRLFNAGFLQEEGDLVLLVHPASNFDQAQVLPLLNSLRQTATSSLAAVNSRAVPKAHFISEAVSTEYRAAGLMPLDLVPLLEDDIDEETLLPLLRLRQELSLDETTFRERFPKIAKSVREALREKLPPKEIVERGKKALNDDEEDDETPPRRPPQGEKEPKEDKEPKDKNEPKDDRPGQDRAPDNRDGVRGRDKDELEDDDDKPDLEDKGRPSGRNEREEDDGSPGRGGRTDRPEKDAPGGDAPSENESRDPEDGSDDQEGD